MNNPLLKLACKYVCYNLRKDPGYWQSWKSNLAMSMYDVLRCNTHLKETKLLKLCNKGAEKFLRLLTR
jgi:hypothetical protein